MARTGLLLIGCAVTLIAVGIATLNWSAPSPAMLVPHAPRARIAVMGSVALMAPESATIAERINDRSKPHPLIEALARAHQLRAIDTLDAQSMAGNDHILLVQPSALTPAEFSALDIFVRNGGRLLLFTDPLLEWPSRFGLVDPRGPLRTGLMAPLLGHWGLELVVGDSPPILPQGLIAPASGQFLKLAKGPDEPQDRCVIDKTGLIARCTIGKGRAILIADADILQPELLDETSSDSKTNRQWVSERIKEFLRN